MPNIQSSPYRNLEASEDLNVDQFCKRTNVTEKIDLEKICIEDYQPYYEATSQKLEQIKSILINTAKKDYCNYLIHIKSINYKINCLSDIVTMHRTVPKNQARLPEDDGTIQHFRKKETGLNIAVEANKKISYLLLKIGLGYGTYKNLYEGVDLTNLRIVAHAVTKINPEKEIKMGKILNNYPWFTHLLHTCSYVSRKHKVLKYSLIMEYCNGGDVYSLLNSKEKIDAHTKQRRIYTIVKHVLLGLVEMEKLGLNHQDLSPKNILLHKDDHNILHAKIADFGSTEFIAEQKALIDQGYVALQGTPKYKFPEFFIVKNKTKILLSEDRKNKATQLIATNKGDLWSLGLILYEMRTESHLYSSKINFKDIAEEKRIAYLTQVDIDEKLDEIQDQDPFHEINKALLTLDSDSWPNAQKCLDIFNNTISEK